ncbi:MAG TPA: LapA family protein [Candidatus Binatia bacterium]|nr:LapA family protein [Candidatus Binatia bacterium]
MYLRTLLILIVLGAVTTFAAINWNAFMAPTKLSVVFANVEAPLGLILLVVVGLLTLLFLLYVAYLQSSVLVENRRNARELQAQRELADQAEASRFNQLRSFLEKELGRLGEKTEESKVGVFAKLEALERDLRLVVEQSGNTLAAYIGEIEDRLERTSGGQSSKGPP